MQRRTGKRLPRSSRSKLVLTKSEISFGRVNSNAQEFECSIVFRDSKCIRRCASSHEWSQEKRSDTAILQQVTSTKRPRSSTPISDSLRPTQDSQKRSKKYFRS